MKAEYRTIERWIRLASVPSGAKALKQLWRGWKPRPFKAFAVVLDDALVPGP
jgi:hypothetical protein